METGQTGFHGRAANPLHFAICCFNCARVATFHHILSHFGTCCHVLSYVVSFCTHVPVKIHSGELRHLCDDPVCPDPVWKLSNMYTHYVMLCHNVIVRVSDTWQETASTSQCFPGSQSRWPEPRRGARRRTRGGAGRGRPEAAWPFPGSPHVMCTYTYTFMCLRVSCFLVDTMILML